MQSRQLSILVADDLEPNLKLISKHLERSGHNVLCARNGIEAVEQFQQHSPDIVLLDVMMPDMNGIEAAEQIRQLTVGKWVPVIFISAMARGEDQIRGLEIGDDYLTKPINLELLDAKIMAMQRIAELQHALQLQNRELEIYRQHAEEEQEMASALMHRIVRINRFDESRLKHWVLPAQRFSGDLVAAARCKTGRLYILHADSTGHGLTAAIPLMPVSQIFYELAEQGYSVPSIVSNINQYVRRYIPTERFVAAIVVCVDYNNHLIEVWNGGCPSLFYVDRDGQVLQTFKSRHLAFGILDDGQFDATTDIMQWQTPGQLVMYSDGFIESRNVDGEMFGEARVSESLKEPGNADKFSTLVDALCLHMNNDDIRDDISLVMVDCD